MENFYTLSSYWPALIFGLLGLAFRWSRMGLPNGGSEPKNPFQQFVSLVKLWVESTVGSFIFVVAVLIAAEYSAELKQSLFFALCAASLLGAAFSDAIGQIVKNPVAPVNWFTEVVLRWTGRQ